MSEPARDAAKAAGERRLLLLRAAIVGAGTLFSRLLGLLRDVALAAVFPRLITDAFFVAFTIPNALRQLLGEGAVSAAVVPSLSARLSQDGEAAAKAFYAKARGVSLAALVVVICAGMLAARPLTELFAAGYKEIPGQFERTVILTRWLFPYLLFIGTAAMGMAALHAHKRFAVASFAPALLNVAFLLAALAFEPLARHAGYDVAYALIAGALLGGLLQVLAQLPALAKLGYLARPRWDLRDVHVREMLRKIVPITFGFGVYYIDLVISRRLLSSLGEGAQSYFSWAMRLCDFPQGIFVMALSTAALPSLASFAARGEHAELGKTYVYGLRVAWFVAVPASVVFFVLAEPLVSTLFLRGEFNAHDAAQTARALAVQGLGMFTVAAVRQSVPVYYALGDTRTPVWISALDLTLFVALALGLRGSLGHVAVSVAVSGSSAAQMLLLMFGLWRRGARMLPKGALRALAAELLGSLVRTAAASALAAGCAHAAAYALRAQEAPAWLTLALAGMAFCAVFLLVAWRARSPELQVLTRAVFARLRRRREAGSAKAT